MLNDNQVGIYNEAYPTQCAISGNPLTSAHNQISLGDNTHFVCVSSSNVRFVTDELRNKWSKQFVKAIRQKKDDE